MDESNFLICFIACSENLTANTKYLTSYKLLRDRISAHGVMYVLPQECAVRLSSTLLLKDIVFH